MSTYNWLDLQTLGSQSIMPKNLPDHWLQLCSNIILIFIQPIKKKFPSDIIRFKNNQNLNIDMCNFVASFLMQITLGQN